MRSSTKRPSKRKSPGTGRPLAVCLYWILKLQARFLSGDYPEALASADKAKALLWAVTVEFQRLDYFYYAALTVAALYENASADDKQTWRDLLAAHQEQLREWAESYPPTFADKHALVSAEIARIEGRELDAMRLYEQAIRSAHDHGFVQNEGVAYEVAARFYARAASRPSPTPICARPGTVICAGAPTARCGNSIGFIRIWRLRGAASRRDQSAPRSNNWTSRAS